MHKLILISDSVGIAATYALLGHVEPIEETPRNATRAQCIQFPNINVRYPVLTALKAVVQGRPLAEFTLGFTERQPDAPLPPDKRTTTISGFGEFALTLMTPIYVDFFERHRPWIKAKFGGDSYAWPMLFNFARVLRNAISHHGGHLHFENKNAAPVSWHSLTWSPVDEGKKVLSVEVDIGDLIILMLEISDELDGLGCPLNP